MVTAYNHSLDKIDLAVWPIGKLDGGLERVKSLTVGAAVLPNGVVDLLLEPDLRFAPQELTAYVMARYLEEPTVAGTPNTGLEVLLELEQPVDAFDIRGVRFEALNPVHALGLVAIHEDGINALGKPFSGYATELTAYGLVAGDPFAQIEAIPGVTDTEDSVPNAMLTSFVAMQASLAYDTAA